MMDAIQQSGLFLPLAQAMAAFRSPAYCIPRAQVRLRFSLRHGKDRRVLFWFRPGASTSNSQELSYEVIAHPRPQPARISRNLLTLPAYLLPASMERDIATKIFPEAQSVACFALPGEMGMLAVQFSSNPALDVHGLHSPTGETTSYAKSSKGWNYKPFRSLFAALRLAQAHGTRSTFPSPTNADPGIGWNGFNVFLQDLWQSYRDATEQLVPHAFALNGFEARFHYSSHERWTQNEISLVFRPADSTLHMDLVRPEFLISGPARDKLLDLLLQPLLIDQLIADCAFHSALPALPAEAFQARPADALLLLSFEGPASTTGFLAVWPTPQGDYLFTLNSNGLRLTAEPKLIAFCPAGEVFLKDNQYLPIHNFLRAYLLWRGKIVDE